MVSIKATLFTILAVIAIVNAATLETGENKKFKGKKWALLVAGANYWYNYGIQADVCHAYQVLHKNGIPDENIVVMMYDDLANNSKNPKPGTLINKPKGPDVYKNVPKDYTGSDVTAENFVNILTGNKEAMNGVGSGKVIESGPDDHVFIYYIDHGGVGLICFPTSELYANDLISALKKMHSEKRYGKLVFFLEACFSGSMFVDLPNNMNIFAVASSKKDESSWFFYHDDTYDTYLGTLYGVAWMEDADKANTQKQSLLSEYNTVKNSVHTCLNESSTCEHWSHVIKFGDQKMGSLKMADFIGSHKKHTLDSIDAKAIPKQQQPVAAFDGPMVLLQKKLERTTNSLERLEIEVKLERIYQIRRAIDISFETIVNYITKEHSVTKGELLNSDRNLSTEEHYTCYKTLLKSYFKNCFDIHKVHYVVTHFQKLVNYCTLPSAANGVPNLVKTIENTCSNFDFGVIDEAM